VPAVDLYCARADTEPIGDGLVCVPLHKQFHDFTLSRSKDGDMLFQGALLLGLVPVLNVQFQGAVNALQQTLLVVRLLDKVKSVMQHMHLLQHTVS